jgi:FkbM family methyltransferase
MQPQQLRQFVNKHPTLRGLAWPLISLRRLFLAQYKKRQFGTYQQLCKILAEDPVVFVEEFSAKFAVDVRSDLFSRLLLENQYEQELVQYCQKYFDFQKDVIDVGANIGFYSVFFARKITAGRKVLSVEPTKNALRRLHKNISINGVEDKIIVYEGAASNFEGTIDINVVEGKEEYSSTGKMQHPAVGTQKSHTEKVNCTTVDALVRNYSLNPGFLKIDVEGVGNLVFEGSKNLLIKNRPVILSELSNTLLKENGSSSSAVIDFLKRYDYQVFDPVFPASRPGLRDFGDILCLPNEMNIKSIT